MKCGVQLHVGIVFLWTVSMLLAPTRAFTAAALSRLRSGHSCRQESTALRSGYLPPERDPEYRSVVKKSLLQPLEGEAAAQAVLPLPREGDVVRYPGKWEGELDLGKIRTLRYENSTSLWQAEIVPLVEGKSDSVYCIDKSSRSLDVAIKELIPVRAYFLQSENGYKVSFRSNSTEVVKKAASYRDLEADFQLPRKELNTKKIEGDMEDYSALKERIISNTLKVGAVGSVAVTAVYGLDAGLPYSLGATSGALYLFLLGKRTDLIGAGYSVSDSSKSLTKVDTYLSNSRLAVPFVLVGSLALFNLAKNGFQTDSIFNTVPREQFLGAIFGFLTYRLSLFLTEVATELRADDVFGFLPGSIAEAYRQSKKMSDSEDAEATTAVDVDTRRTRVVFVTGPLAGGRGAVVRGLVDKCQSAPAPKKFRKEFPLSKLKRIRYMTNDAQFASSDPERFRIVDDEKLAILRQEGKLIYESVESNAMGQSATVALCLEGEGKTEGERASSGGGVNDDPVLLLEGTPNVLDAMSKEKSLQLINIWISLQTKEQFIEKATSIIQSEFSDLRQKGSSGESSGADLDALAKEGGQKVANLVDEAARDINYYMRKAPLFEYTLLNTGREQDTIDELAQLLENVL